MRSIFLDPELGREFDEKGYVTLSNILNQEEVNFFYQFYLDKMEKNEINEEGKYNPEYAEFTIVHSRKKFREEVYSLINSRLQERVSNILDRCKPLITNYIRKDPGGLGSLPIHQNWSLVDEKKFLSVSVWIPLVDATTENGTLEFVDGSHTMFRGKRGTWGSLNFVDAEPVIREKYLKAINVKAGDCIILDDSVLHYSRPNFSDKLRLAIQIIMIPEEAQGMYYYKDPETEGDLVDVFEVDEKYFFDFENWIGNEANVKSKKKVKVKVPFYDKEKFEKDFEKGLAKAKRRNFFNRIISFLK